MRYAMVTDGVRALCRQPRQQDDDYPWVDRMDGGGTKRVLDKAWQAGLLAAADADVLRPAARLYHNLTQVLRLCLSAPFDPKAAGGELPGLPARAADLPDFATLEPHLAETQARVRASFGRIVGGAG
jgi:[glutamine synthetase] adenylyltransferase / [glutamine synthetase]-adenylyl-L-tyrosine phosphorylase